MNQFSAAASALGYVYQCEVALLGYLLRNDPAIELALEVLDDVSYVSDGQELVQVKLRLQPGNVSDNSAELWKTLRVWAESARESPDAQLTLFTTSRAPEGSVASLLRLDEDRDTATAARRLVDLARAASSASLAKAYATFLRLAEDEREDLIGRVIVADDAPRPSDLGGAFDRALVHAAPTPRRSSLTQRLREWWLGRCTQHLISVARGDQATINGEEIENQIADLRDQFAAGNLPNDFEYLPEPTEEELDAEQRVFVLQLRLIGLSNPRIRKAVHDHNRAFAQRSQWQRENLVDVGELKRYERRLVDEWDRLFLPLSDDERIPEDEACRRGQELHQACDQATFPPIRPLVSAPHIQRGSMQMLADEARIGWHPDWVARLQALLEAA